MTSKKKTKTEQILTLGAYSYGNMRSTGPVTEADIEHERLVFVESIVPVLQMIQEFNEWNLGTKIKVTLEIQK